MVRFRCIRSNGNARKRHETGNGNTGYPSCFRNGLTCFCHVSVYGFLQFRPVLTVKRNLPHFIFILNTLTCITSSPIGAFSRRGLVREGSSKKEGSLSETGIYSTWGGGVMGEGDLSDREVH